MLRAGFCAAAFILMVGEAQAQVALVQFDLPALPLNEALRRIAETGDIALSYRSEVVQNRLAQPVQGLMTPQQAIALAADSAGLEVRWLDPRSGVIMTSSVAQEPTGLDQESAGERTEAIVVVGSRLVRRSALQAKQSAELTLDAIGGDELGLLPDRSSGELVDRLPGVSMLVEKGEGRYVQVRGLDPALSVVSLDGLLAGSPEAELGGRQTSLDIFSAGLLSGVSVLKTRGADLDGRGIGGVVNLQTRAPFDQTDNFYGSLSVRVGYEEDRPQPQAYGGADPYAVDGYVSGKWQDRYGWLLGASYSAREYIGRGLYQDDWTAYDNFALPQRVKNNFYVIGRERLNLLGAIEARPNVHDRHILSIFHVEWNEFQHRLRFEQDLTDDLFAVSPNQGTAGVDEARTTLRLEHASKSLTFLSARGNVDLGAFSVRYQFGANNKELEEPYDAWSFRSDAIFGPRDWRIDQNGVVTTSTQDSAPDFLDASLYSFGGARFFDRALNEDMLHADVAFSWRASNLWTLHAGISASRTHRDLDEGSESWGPSMRSFTLADNSALFDGGFINVTPHGEGANFWLNASELNAFLATPSNSDLFALEEDDAGRADFGADYDIVERKFGGFFEAAAHWSVLDFRAGVRLERTSVDAGAYDLAGATAWRRGKGGYAELLPSLLLTYRPTDDLVLRASATRHIAPQSYARLAPYTNFVARETDTLVVRTGEPDLAPRRADELDASFEWYPSPLSLVSVAAFYKRIDGEASRVVTSYNSADAIAAELAFWGISPDAMAQLALLEVEAPAANGSSFVGGVEFNLQAQLNMIPWLEDFGVAASLTFIDGHTEFPEGERALLGQPKRTYAFTGYYQRGGIDATLSYSFNDDYLTSFGETRDGDLNQGSFGRWDARASYSVGPSLRVFVEALNLSDEPTTEFQGGRENWNTEYEYVGRTFYLGATHTF